MKAVALPGGGYGVFVPGADAIDLVPGCPQPEPSAGRQPIRLLTTGRETFVSLGACWPVPEHWLRTRLPALHPHPGFSGKASQLRIAIAGTPTLTLAVASPAGREPTPLVTVDTSGYPPFNAILGISVGPDAAGALHAAVAGEAGRAFVTITAQISPGLALDAAVLSGTDLAVVGRTVTATADLAAWQHNPSVTF